MSPSLTQEATGTVEVLVDAELQQQLLQEVKIYEALKAEADDAAADLAAQKALIESIRAEAGAKKIELPGDYGVTRVDGGTTNTLSKKKVYALGISKAELDSCYTRKPKKGHTLILLPGDKAKALANGAKPPQDERDTDDEDGE